MKYKNYLVHKKDFLLFLQEMKAIEHEHNLEELFRYYKNRWSYCIKPPIIREEKVFNCIGCDICSMQ